MKKEENSSHFLNFLPHVFVRSYIQDVKHHTLSAWHAEIHVFFNAQARAADGSWPGPLCIEGATTTTPIVGDNLRT